MRAREVYIEDDAEAASSLLKAMANPSRLTALCLMTEGELSVSQLEDAIGLSQSALSQHLARLRHDGLVRTRREAQTIYYSLAGDRARVIIDALASLGLDPKAVARQTA